MKKFFCSHTSLFLADYFNAEFTDMTGEIKKRKISGAYISYAALRVNAQTGEPLLLESEDDKCEDYLGQQTSRASISEIFGAIVIPRTDIIEEFHEKGILDDNCDIGFKITNYYLLTAINELHEEICEVPEFEFRRIITENFTKFNKPENYYVPAVGYIRTNVSKTYNRECFDVGLDENDNLVIVHVPGEEYPIIDHICSCKTKESAKQVKEFLEDLKPQKSPDIINTLDQLTERSKKHD